MREPLTRKQVWERSHCMCESDIIPCIRCEDSGKCSSCNAECYFPHHMSRHLCDACKSTETPEKARTLTAKLQIKKYLLGNPKGITTLDAIRMFNHTRLAARIHELREDGIDIVTVYEEGVHWFRLREGSK